MTTATEIADNLWRIETRVYAESANLVINGQIVAYQLRAPHTGGPIILWHVGKYDECPRIAVNSFRFAHTKNPERPSGSGPVSTE